MVRISFIFILMALAIGIAIGLFLGSRSAEKEVYAAFMKGVLAQPTDYVVSGNSYVIKFDSSFTGKIYKIER